MDTLLEPCLSLANETSRLGSFSVFNSELPNWKNLTENPKVQRVKVFNIKQLEKNGLLIQLALAIKSHPRITRVTFNSCEIEDLGAFCLAVAEKHQLATLEFYNCRLGHCAAQSLQYMLEANLIESLALENGNTDNDDFQQTISSGLSKNRSLKKLTLSHLNSNLDIKMGVHDMLISNHNLEELCLSLSTNQQWDLFRAVDRLKALKTLYFEKSVINLQAMEAIMMMSFAISSLQTLSFTNCAFHDTALEFLVRTLSCSSNVITTLRLVEPDLEDALEVDFGTMQVENLFLVGVTLEESAFASILDSVSSNCRLKSLNLSPGVLCYCNEAFQGTCDVIIRQSNGPSELAIEVDDNDVTILTEAMAANTSLKALSVDYLNASDNVIFAESVASMHFLRKLEFKSECKYSEDFFAALLSSMELNTSLWTITFECLHDDDKMAVKFLPQIRQILAINRVGRHQLMRVPIPVGLWSRVLARSSNERDGIYFVLTERPDIITSTRKRQREADI